MFFTPLLASFRLPESPTPPHRGVFWPDGTGQELVIEPDGTVSACDVLTSDLADEELISRVMRRVQLFDFGERDVAVTRMSYPVHFLPT